jgi:ribosomal protein S12 methylthiotransferase accessory factor
MEVKIEGKKKISANLNGQTIMTDQPVQAGGDGSAPSPFDLFLASIGTCAGIYVKNFCDQRGLSAENIRIIQKLSFDQNKRLIDRIDLEIQLPDDFPEKYKEAVIKAANLCTVKRHLQDAPDIETYTKTNSEVGS